LSVK